MDEKRQDCKVTTKLHRRTFLRAAAIPGVAAVTGVRGQGTAATSSDNSTPDMLEDSITGVTQSEELMVYINGGPFYEDDVVKITVESDTYPNADVLIEVYSEDDDSGPVHSVEDQLAGTGSRTLEIIPGPQLTGAGKYTAVVQLPEHGETTQVQFEVLPETAVNISEITSPVREGDIIEILIKIENLTQQARSTTLSVDVPGIESEAVQLTLDGGAVETEKFTFPTGSGSAGEYIATAGADGDSDQREVTILPPVAFTVTVVDVTEPQEGEALEVTTEISNTDVVAATRTVTLDIGELGETSTEVELAAGESEEVVLSVSTGDGDAGEYTAAVDADTDSDSTEVTILEPATFAVEITSAADPVAGDSLSVGATVENTGDVEGTETVGLSAGALGGDEAEVTLAGGESEEVSLSVPTSGSDVGEYPVTVEAGTDSDSSDVTVLEPASFAVEITSAADPVAGDSLSVGATVENTGEVEGTETVGLSAGALGSDGADVTLAAGESTEETLSVPTGEGDAGEYAVTVEAGTDSDSTDVTVLEPAAFILDNTEVANRVTDGTLDVRVAIENTGDVSGSKTVELSASEFENVSRTVQVDGGELTTAEFAVESTGKKIGEHEITLDTGDDTATAPVVIPPPEFEISSISDPEVPAGSQLNMTITVTNTGGVEATETVEYGVGALGNGSVTVTLDAGESKTESVALDTSRDAIGNHSLTITTGNDSENGTVSVKGPGFGVGGTLAALAGAAYLLKRRMTGESEDER